MKDKEIRKIRKYQIKIAMLIYFCHWVWLSCVVQHEACILWESRQYDCVMEEFVRKHVRVGRDKKDYTKNPKSALFQYVRNWLCSLNGSVLRTGAQGIGHAILFIKEKKARRGGRTLQHIKETQILATYSVTQTVCRHLFLQLWGGGMMSDISRSHVVQIPELGEWLGEIRFCSLCLTKPS